MTYQPLISIIVPVYNKAAYLQRCIDSITCQTIVDFEAIFINDASKDESANILKANAIVDRRIRVYTHNENMGIILTRKRGIEESQGKYIQFIDADDIAYPEMCQELYNLAFQKNADFVQCNAEVYDPESILTDEIYRYYNNSLKCGKNCTYAGKSIFKHYRFPIRNILFVSMYKTETCKKLIPYIKNNAPKRGDDDLLTFFLAYFSTKYASLDKILYKYRASPTSANLNRVNYELAKSQIIGRAHAINYAKWFAQKNKIIWQRNKKPFSAFTEGLVDYAASFIDRLRDDTDKKDELIRLFGDRFKGEATIFLMKRIDDYLKISGDKSYTIKELNAVYSSRSWKITAPLRWGIRKIRGY
jgi:glycosyltransferase involved in cell wall biosynthesis